MGVILVSVILTARKAFPEPFIWFLRTIQGMKDIPLELLFRDTRIKNLRKAIRLG